MKKNAELIILFIFMLIIFSSFTKSSQSSKKLPERYKKWLEEEVVYIITPNEKEVFLQLETDKDRDIFIEAFWNHRDPTPGTPENEYKKEHYRRLSFANQRFGIGSPKPGWQTDRGRIYIILGEPHSKEVYESQRELKDTEIWFYQDMNQYGLPTAFHIVFYRDSFAGDYKLYRPTVDGPGKFFIQTPPLDTADYLACYEYLKQYNSMIAEVSLSLIPGDSSQLTGQPSLSSELLLQNIRLKPQKEVDDLYAQKFLNYKALVEVEYSANFIRCDYFIQPIRDSAGNFFVHYAVSPERLSVNEYQGVYSTSFVLNGHISNLNGQLIYQFEKQYEVKLEKKEIEQTEKIPIQIQDMFPLIPGEYVFSLLLKNTVSKEFTSFEERISIPAKLEEIQLSSPLLGYSLRDISESIPAHRSFQIKKYLLFVDSENIFLPSDNLYVYFQILGLNQTLQDSGTLSFTITKESNIIKKFENSLNSYSDPENILETIQLDHLQPAHYQLIIQLTDSTEKKVASTSKTFSVSASPEIPRPLIKSKALPLEKNHYYDFLIGLQLFNSKKYADAIPYLKKAYSRQPDNIEFASYLGKSYYTLNNYNQAEKIFEPFLNREDVNYDLLFTAALTAKQKLDFQKALHLFQVTANRFGINVFLLNHLGDCHFYLNQENEAIAAWQKSLELNPEQPQIKQKIKDIREKNKTLRR